MFWLLGNARAIGRLLWLSVIIELPSYACLGNRPETVGRPMLY